MLVLMHVFAAVASLALAGVNLRMPSSTKLKLTHGLTGQTLFSGALLVFSDDRHILATCITGLIYLGAIAAATVLGRQRLNKINLSKETN